MIDSIINYHFLYWQDDKVDIYPGCKEEDNELLLIIDKPGPFCRPPIKVTLKALYSFNSELLELHQIDLSSINPLEVEFILQDSLPPYNLFTKEVLTYMYNRNGIGKEYYEENMKLADRRLKEHPLQFKLKNKLTTLSRWIKRKLAN